MNVITSIAELESLYGETVQGALTKVQSAITPQYKRWINQSRFLILTTVGFFIGLLVSRLGVMFVSSLMEESLNYNLNSFGILKEELWLLGLSIFIGLISSIIPALQVYNLNISETLADE